MANWYDELGGLMAEYTDNQRREVAKRMREKMYLLNESDDGWNPIEAIEVFCQALHVDCSVCEGPDEWLSKALDEIKPRLMPEGMEWPRYTDGEPVRPMDTVYARVECGPGARRKPKKITQLAFANPTEATVRVEYDYMSGYEPNDTWGFLRVPEMKPPYEKEQRNED